MGCIVLTQPFFWPEERWIPVPESWAMNIVSGRGYDLADADGRRLSDACAEGAASSLLLGAADPPAPRYGEPVLVRPRLGQGAFRLAVTEAYARRCVVTHADSDRTRPPVPT